MNQKRKSGPSADFDQLIPLIINVWRKLHKIKGGPSDKLQTREFRGVIEAIDALQKLKDHSQDYFKSKKLLGGYLLYSSLLHYAQALTLLSEIPHPFSKVLDLGSGSAPLALASLKHGASEVYALDRNQEALKLGAEICGKMGYPLTIRPWELESELSVEGQFDLIMIGHALYEFFPVGSPNWLAKQQKLIQQLLKKLTPQGHLLLIEDSWPAANLPFLQLRDRLVSEGVKIQAPCIWQGNCPALQHSKSPCFAQRPFEKPYLIGELQRAAKINLSSLKMSYLLLRADAKAPLSPYEHLYRVVSPPVPTVRGKCYHLCGTGGKKSLISSFETHPEEARAFDYLKRGELIEIKGALENNEHFQVTQETEITLRAALGKPLPFT